MTAEPELAVADAGRADPENRILLLLPLDSPTRLQPAQPLLPRRDACVRKAPKGRVWQRDVREGVCPVVYEKTKAGRPSLDVAVVPIS